ncbi:uncharacterized protein LOC130898611 [Diorhabda carinulata]|uniref:uncharacterized protein LOC130898611 n=1 Tax=Diorhabda carinulata TaxID=1163345 RepID=UPI0025A234B8|nr:uncharacterized protein LOC130898611 [Diorhabda carinulata]
MSMIYPRHRPYDDEISLSFKRPCVCTEENLDYERNYVYVEGTQTDKNVSTNISELSENVWYEIRPPKLFAKQIVPVVTSRQTYIARILLDGKLTNLEEAEDDEVTAVKKENTIKNVSMNIKKSAVRFLGKAGVDFDF